MTSRGAKAGDLKIARRGKIPDSRDLAAITHVPREGNAEANSLANHGVRSYWMSES